MPMDNRNTVQLNSFVGCLGNSSTTGLKNQMKESKASERKTTQQSLFFHLIALRSFLLYEGVSEIIDFTLSIVSWSKPNTD